MAEYVHQTLEEMIPELEEMKEIGLFTVKETKNILKKRESYEYKLRQLTKTKSSFLNYIEYEKKLLELLKIRRKKLGQHTKKRDVEKAIADRIHKLYRLVTLRFSEDISLWEQHIEFSKVMNEKAYVSRLYGQVLKIHSHNPDLWLKAAQWESSDEGNSNHELAREILLKGQRVNPESESLFLEMFRMELQLAKVLIKRKAILKISTNETNGENELAPELRLPFIIYNKSKEIFPGRADLHLKLLIICCSVKEGRPLQDLIVSDLEESYPDNPKVWNGLALRYINKIKTVSKGHRKEAISKCLAVYEKALEKLPNDEMWSLCLTALLGLTQRAELSRTEWLTKSTLQLSERAIQLGFLSDVLYIQLLELLQQLGMAEDLLAVSRLATKDHPTCVPLWHIRLRAESGQGHDKLQDVFQTATKHVSREDSWPLWELMLNYLTNINIEEVQPLVMKACRSVTAQLCKPAKVWYLHWSFQHCGIKELRQVYNSLKSMRPVSAEFFRLYIQMESSQLKIKHDLIRAAFEEAVVEFGHTQSDIWLNYIHFESAVAKDCVKSAEIHQRALLGLGPQQREKFIRKHVLYCL
ncbi:U3 small nucleolar RNA-associated protein 6 homolog [Physella acuta]|uniref:U3 small nucleolar RNA-associated protein 6 homolog n=1 Tax=Physella acuta TaxID=109671 RepID=UPI0027DD2C10|nr:U3 small nucleolar RNA-associated protein 6 homolog [Physella acuta]